ncbi:MAG: EAL domain-containing protein [Deltaproteobacteria bacterium]|nr:EAL domain-containing protein [Deltaproteobacteria bacterium]
MKETSPVYGADFIGQSTRRVDGQTYGAFKGCRLSSVYQPIFSLAHKRIVGYEALIRAENSQNQAIRPDELFRPEESLSDIVLLDRLCRYIHIDNFQAFGDRINWLFLNVSPQTIIHGKEFGSFFGSVLERFDLPSYRVIIEIVEYPISGADNIRLIETVKYYHELGCLIAIDDFGAGYSNFDRIWTLKPDIVKLDRSMLLRATDRKNIRQLLPGIVSLLHQAGSLVIIEGIETEEQAIIALESDADMVQGYFFARPHHDLSELSGVTPPFKSLFESYKASEALRGKEFQHTYHRYHKPFQTAVILLKTGHSLVDSSKPLFEDDSIIRCYLLEPSGLQIGYTVTSQVHADKVDLRFKPLEDAKSADWFRRHYLRRAIMHPGQLQITRPYLSITGAHMCSTLSMMIHTSSGDIILCCDLKL